MSWWRENAYAPFPQKQDNKEMHGTASPSWTLMSQPPPPLCTYRHTHQPQGLSTHTGLVSTSSTTGTAPSSSFSSSSQPWAQLKSQLLPFLLSSRLLPLRQPWCQQRTRAERQARALVMALPPQRNTSASPTLPHLSKLQINYQHILPIILSAPHPDGSGFTHSKGRTSGLGGYSPGLIHRLGRHQPARIWPNQDTPEGFCSS